jgi:hypothetical protein
MKTYGAPGAYGSRRRLGGHHGLELVEGDDPVAISVHRRDDLCAPLSRHLLPDDTQPPQRAEQLLRGDHAVAVLVVLGERSAQRVRQVFVLEQRPELLEADEPVTIAVCSSDHLLRLRGRAPAGLAHLGHRDAAIAIRVEVAEDADELRLRCCIRERWGTRRGGSSCRRQRRGAASAEDVAARGGGGDDETHYRRRVMASAWDGFASLDLVTRVWAVAYLRFLILFLYIQEAVIDFENLAKKTYIPRLKGLNFTEILTHIF